MKYGAVLKHFINKIQLLILLLFGVVLEYNGCVPQHSEGSYEYFNGQLGLGSGGCGSILQQEFTQGYRGFLQTNCSNCHISGGQGKGAFADSSIKVAYSAFMGAGNQKISEFATNPSHQPPYTGNQHSSSISNLQSSWMTAQTKYDECILNSQNRTPDNQTSDDLGNRRTTKEKPIGATTDYTLKTFDLATEIISPQSFLSGVKIEVAVKRDSAVSNETSYLFRNPKLYAGGQALEIKDLRLIINGTLYTGGTTWENVSRKVPVQDNRLLSSGVLIYQGVLSATDTFALSIKSIEPTSFNPPTYTQLISANGILGKNCISCHTANNARGSLNMNNYDEMINHFVIIPFDINSSLLVERIENSSNPMPPNGSLLSSDQIQSLKDWILDGAPKN